MHSFDGPQIFPTPHCAFVVQSMHVFEAKSHDWPAGHVGRVIEQPAVQMPARQMLPPAQSSLVTHCEHLPAVRSHFGLASGHCASLAHSHAGPVHSQRPPRHSLPIMHVTAAHAASTQAP